MVMVATHFPLVAAIGIPDARHCLIAALPVVCVLAVSWFLKRIDSILAWLFPHWEWERKLGWLNIRAERQADAFLRWVRYLVYALLAMSLYGIVWGAQALAWLDQMDDPRILAEIVARVPVLLISLGFWLSYLGLVLIPKLRNEYEFEELQKYRAEQAILEKEHERARSSRLKPRHPDKTPPLRSNRFGPGE